MDTYRCYMAVCQSIMIALPGRTNNSSNSHGSNDRRGQKACWDEKHFRDSMSTFAFKSTDARKMPSVI